MPDILGAQVFELDITYVWDNMMLDVNLIAVFGTRCQVILHFVLLEPRS